MTSIHDRWDSESVQSLSHPNGMAFFDDHVKLPDGSIWKISHDENSIPLEFTLTNGTEEFTVNLLDFMKITRAQLLFANKKLEDEKQL